MPISGSLISRLAVEVVLATRRSVNAPKSGAAASIRQARVGRDLLALAEAFYACEERYAMNVCFYSRDERATKAARGARRSHWRERRVYRLVASLIASLAPGVNCSARAGANLDPMALIRNRRFQALSDALDGPGYLGA